MTVQLLGPEATVHGAGVRPHAWSHTAPRATGNKQGQREWSECDMCVQLTAISSARYVRRGLQRGEHTGDNSSVGCGGAPSRIDAGALTTETFSLVSCTRYFWSLNRCVSGCCPATMGSACGKAAADQDMISRLHSPSCALYDAEPPVRSGKAKDDTARHAWGGGRKPWHRSCTRRSPTCLR